MRSGLLMFVGVLLAAGRLSGSEPTVSWGVQFGTESLDCPYGITAGPSGHVSVVGSYGDSVGFVMRYDEHGVLQWGHNLGGQIRSVDVGTDNVIHFTGYAVGDLFAPSAGGADTIIGAYDASGNLTWGAQPGVPYGDYGYGIAVDPSGNTYVTGSAYPDSMPSPGSERVTLKKYDALGQLLWERTDKLTSSSDCGQAVAVDALGNAYVN